MKPYCIAEGTVLEIQRARAAKGEFVRWDTPIYRPRRGKETIIIDAQTCAPPTRARKHLRAELAGFDHHLAKPIDVDALEPLFATQPDRAASATGLR